MSKLALTNDNVFLTVQGEGMYTGRLSTFVRLSSCNLRCSWQNPDGTITICDTPYSSYKPEILRREIDEIVEEILTYKNQHVVITGGEPFLQPNVAELIEKLQANQKLVTVETNATVFVLNNAHCLSMSPKLKTSSVPTEEYYATHQEKRYRPDVIASNIMSRSNVSTYQLKFVVNTLDDITEIKQIHEDVKAELFKQNCIFAQDELNDHTWLMPQGVSTAQFDEKAQWVIEQCRQNSWNYADRVHIRVYGHQRGV